MVAARLTNLAHGVRADYRAANLPLCSPAEEPPESPLDEDEIDRYAELAEIDENLMRAELTAAQEAAAIFRRKAIYEELRPETKSEAFKGNRHTGSSSERKFCVH